MKLPIRIESDAAGQPVMWSGSYAILDANNRRIAIIDLDSEVGCVGTVQTMRHICRMVNYRDHIIRSLKALVEMGVQTIKDIGGCDHSVNICCCEDKQKLEDGAAVLKAISDPLEVGEQRRTDLVTDLAEALRWFVVEADEMGTVRKLEAFGNVAEVDERVGQAKLLLAEIERGR